MLNEDLIIMKSFVLKIDFSIQYILSPQLLLDSPLPSHPPKSSIQLKWSYQKCKRGLDKSIPSSLWGAFVFVLVSWQIGIRYPSIWVPISSKGPRTLMKWTCLGGTQDSEGGNAGDMGRPSPSRRRTQRQTPGISLLERTIESSAPEYLQIWGHLSFYESHWMEIPISPCCITLPVLYI